MRKCGQCAPIVLVAAFSTFLIGVPASAQDMYALDGFGGVHAVNGAPIMSPPTAYFGFDVAEAIEVLPGGAGYYVLDAFGGLHAGGGAPPPSSVPPYFGFDVARDLSLVPEIAAGLDFDTFPVSTEFSSITPCGTSPFRTVLKQRTINVPESTTTSYVVCRASGKNFHSQVNKYLFVAIDDVTGTGYDEFSYTGTSSTAFPNAYAPYAMQVVYTISPSGGAFTYYLKACRQDATTTGTAYHDHFVCEVFPRRY